MTILRVTSNIRDYEVVFSRDFDFMAELSLISPRAVIIDRNVFYHYESLLCGHFDPAEIFLFDAVETNKSLAMLEQLYDWLIQREAKRNMTLISIGGGITQDVTGFAASTIYRGIPWLFVPTTLLAQTDSCIGSKTSINYHRYKNLLGTFYPPNRLYINTDFRSTLTDLDYYSGVGEIIKLQLMKEHDRPSPQKLAALLATCRQDNEILDAVVRENLATKISYMENDEFDRGRRNLLNYGHCLGHALESASGYAIPHGIAVNIGIVFANLLAVERGLLAAGYCEELFARVNKPNIFMPLLREYVNDDALLAGLRNDKKRVGAKLSVVIPDHDMRLMKVDDVDDEEVVRTLARLRAILCI